MGKGGVGTTTYTVSSCYFRKGTGVGANGQQTIGMAIKPSNPKRAKPEKVNQGVFETKSHDRAKERESDFVIRLLI